MSGARVPEIDAAGRVCFDTAPLIYYFQDNPDYAPLLEPIFRRIQRGQAVGVVSTVSLLEICVRPYQRGDAKLAAEYRRILSDRPNFILRDVDDLIAMKAATLRADSGAPPLLKTPDAVILATAVLEAADILVTNDLKLRRFSPLPILCLSEMLPSRDRD